MSTEGSRMANLLASSRECMAAEALAKARALGSRGACGALCGVSQGNRGPDPPIPSMLLSATVTNCYSSYQTLEGCVPESIRLARMVQRTIDNSTNPFDPDARFSVYARKFIAPCPPDPAWYKNAGEPILQGTNCPLPNNPSNPVLPV